MIIPTGTRMALLGLDPWSERGRKKSSEGVWWGGWGVRVHACIKEHMAARSSKETHKKFKGTCSLTKRSLRFYLEKKKLKVQGRKMSWRKLGGSVKINISTHVVKPKWNLTCMWLTQPARDTACQGRNWRAGQGGGGEKLFILQGEPGWRWVSGTIAGLVTGWGNYIMTAC